MAQLVGGDVRDSIGEMLQEGGHTGPFHPEEVGGASGQGSILLRGGCRADAATKWIRQRLTSTLNLNACWATLGKTRTMSRSNMMQLSRSN